MLYRKRKKYKTTYIKEHDYDSLDFHLFRKNTLASRYIVVLIFYRMLKSCPISVNG